MSNPIQDNDELESLFDSIVAAQQEGQPEAPETPCPSCDNSEMVFNKLGLLTRTLHNSLRELGLDKNLETVVSSIPDARDRLSYVAAMTRQAAERVLNATDAAQPVIDKIQSDAHALSGDWQRLFEGKMSIDQFKNLVTRTHAYLVEVPRQTKAANAFLHEIMMAQDFQDLTGQVIKKVVEVTQQMEQQLVDLLMESAGLPRQKEENGLLNGPVINPVGRADIVTSQDQVDGLLESLGF